eukprot:TRINITY_DN11919_c0_g1_i3.p1 TRINITY_DN11919_c0_g1~~TRINITY_DN11919_c0_g1_i3.p1  ORF type:complete len:233 (+),score=8.61 TRINITY_DN11919_c0_g1_i3:106-804(+)
MSQVGISRTDCYLADHGHLNWLFLTCLAPSMDGLFCTFPLPREPNCAGCKGTEFGLSKMPVIGQEWRMFCQEYGYMPSYPLINVIMSNRDILSQQHLHCEPLFHTGLTTRSMYHLLACAYRDVFTEDVTQPYFQTDRWDCLGDWNELTFADACAKHHYGLDLDVALYTLWRHRRSAVLEAGLCFATGWVSTVYLPDEDDTAQVLWGYLLNFYYMSLVRHRITLMPDHLDPEF